MERFLYIFGLLLLVVGAVALLAAAGAPDVTGSIAGFLVGPGLLVAGILFLAVGQALRLLTEIRDRLPKPPEKE